MKRSALAGILPVLLVASVEAQAPSVVTEAEYLSVLEDHHPAVIEAAQAVAAARARALEATTRDNPALGVAREDLDGPSVESELALSWQLPHPSRRLEIAARQAAVEAADAHLEEDLRELRSTLREAYAGWAVADARRQVLEKQAERVEALARREAARAEGGESSRLEAHRLSLAASGLRARTEMAAAESDAARARAAAFHPDLPDGALPALPGLPPPWDTAPHQDHPAVRSAEAALEAAALEHQATGRFIRSPEVTLGWKREEQATATLDGPIFGFGWSLPLFDRNQAAKALADAHRAAAEARLETVRRHFDAEQMAAHAAYRRLFDAQAAATESTGGNPRMLAGAEAAFRHGEGTLTDLLDTLRAAAEAELTVLELQAAALAAHRQLERLEGQTLPTDRQATDADPADLIDPDSQEHLP